jgi:transposase InsO family protein
MDFIVGLPNTSLRHDSIWVIVDRLTKSAHFLHGIPKMIVSNHGAQFIAWFWEQLQDALGTKLIRSSAYHPQTDGQTERVNQILEDMLRACVLQYDKNWDKCLSLLNSLITTIIRLVSKWLRSKHCTVADAKLL